MFLIELFFFLPRSDWAELGAALVRHGDAGAGRRVLRQPVAAEKGPPRRHQTRLGRHHARGRVRPGPRSTRLHRRTGFAICFAIFLLLNRFLFADTGRISTSDSVRH